MEHISKIKIKIITPCEECDGVGFVPINESNMIEEERCYDCKGEGEVEKEITLEEFSNLIKGSK